MCDGIHLEVTTFCILTTYVHIVFYFRPPKNQCCPQKANRSLDFKTNICGDNADIQR